MKAELKFEKVKEEKAKFLEERVCCAGNISGQ